MPLPPLPGAIQTFLAQPNPAVITSVRPDGQPVSVPTWYGWHAGRILVNMDEGRKRIDYLRADPRVTVTVMDRENWYIHVSVQGRVVAWEPDDDLARVDELAQHYLGANYPDRERRRISAWVEIDRWHGWDTTTAWEPHH